mmetsp:Transcript_34565/g.68044  ORF Transcript_34565/g.68044 Transcript_34565/m.68044 type:complete len:630 (+) Transcript_34565:68-1957(+)
MMAPTKSSGSERSPLIKTGKSRYDGDDLEAAKVTHTEEPDLTRWTTFFLIGARFASPAARIGLVLANLCVLFDQTLGSFIPFIFGKIIDTVSADDNMVTRYWLYAYVTCGVFKGLFHFGQHYGFLWLVEKVAQELRQDLLNAIFHMEVGFFDTTNSGELSARLYKDCTECTKAGEHFMKHLGEVVFSVVATLAFALTINVELTLLTFLAVPFLILSSSIVADRMFAISKKCVDANADAMMQAQDAIGNVRVVKNYAAEPFELKQFKVKQQVVFSMESKRSFYDSIFKGLNQAWPLLSASIVLFYGSFLIQSDTISLGDLTVFMMYQTQVLKHMGGLADHWTRIIGALGSAEKILKLLYRSEIQGTMNYEYDVPSAPCEGKIQFQNVNFSYPTQQNVLRLKNMNLEVTPGQVVALVGKSGGGKSTVLQLLKDSYKSNDGEVLLDGLPVQRYARSFLHNSVAMVEQTPTLFARSIRDNIAYGIEETAITDEQVTAAAKLANADSFISLLPDGYNTKLGERGVTLSGGQQQRVSIARALVREPKVLLLDEATASLDSESEHVVHQAIDSLMTSKSINKSMTLIIVAHRLSTVRNADLIVVIDDGEIVERGSHEELLCEDGVYCQLVQKQLHK